MYYDLEGLVEGGGGGLLSEDGKGSEGNGIDGYNLLDQSVSMDLGRNRRHVSSISHTRSSHARYLI